MNKVLLWILGYLFVDADELFNEVAYICLKKFCKPVNSSVFKSLVMLCKYKKNHDDCESFIAS